MEFKKVDNVPKIVKPKISDKYPTDLQMYLDPPADLVDIEYFQSLAVERVKLLRILEIVYLRNIRDVPLKNQVTEEMIKQDAKMFLPLVKGYADEETRRKDYLSHFILRLCYCRSEEYRRWFLARELEFFKLKFYNMDRKEDIVLFMQKSNLNYSPISDAEKRSLSNELINSTLKNIQLDLTSFYKVPFTQVLDLVRSRRVLIKDGMAYVPNRDLISILSALFRTKLSFALSVCAANLPTLEGDERLARIVKGLHNSYTGTDYNLNDDKQVPYTAIDGLSKKSFPPCMRAMYDTFKKTHHLRHMARLQFGLFLKGIGVSFDDSMRFWKEGFMQKTDIDADVFQKKYSYGVRYNYALEGKRANFTPHSCMKIITTSVGAGENHGCPFKHYDALNLRQLLSSYGLAMQHVGEISDLAGQSHYQLACTRFFEVTHGVQNAVGINHPNQFFEESQNLISGKADASKGNYVRKPNSQAPYPAKKVKQGDEWGDDSFSMDLTAIMDAAEKN